MRQCEKYLIVIFLCLFCSTCFSANNISVFIYNWRCCLCNEDFYGLEPPTIMECKSKKSLFHIWVLKQIRYRPNIPREKVG
jgi:hypothetical protein